jgi:SAM-dependent methyltransferase
VRDEILATVRPLLEGRRRVLEVGCGDGRLAAALARAGHEVTAIDLHPPAELAPGVRFVAGDFLAFVDAPFEAVLFTASLHHIAPLADAVARAHDLLVPGGLLWADDFDLEAPDEATARWYFAQQGRTDGSVALWRADHEPGLHVGAALIAAVTARFGGVIETRGPYLHRYLGDRFEPLERAGIADGTLRPVGLRLLAVRARI